MLEDMIRTVTHKVIAQDYAFLKAPAVLYAVVTKVTQLGETFSYDDLVIYNDDTGTCFRGILLPTGTNIRSRPLTVGGMWTALIRPSPTSARGYSLSPEPLFPSLWRMATSRQLLGR